MKGMEIRWHGESYTRTIRNNLNDRLDVVGRLLVRTLKKNVATPAPPHSEEGEFPHKMSGELQESFFYTTDKRSLRLTVHNLAPHAGIVENTRPYMRKTFQQMRSTIRQKMLAAGITKGHFERS